MSAVHSELSWQQVAEPKVSWVPLWVLVAISLAPLLFAPIAVLLTLPLALAIGVAISSHLHVRARLRYLMARDVAISARLQEIENHIVVLREEGSAAQPTVPHAFEQQAGARAAAVDLKDLDLDLDLDLTPPVRAETAAAVPIETDKEGADSAAMRPSAPPPHSGASVVDSAWKFARAWLLGGNTVARVGLLLLFVGIAFLLRYVAERTHLPIELRLLGVAAGAVAFLIAGWRMRHARPGFAITLQGGAIGLLYLTTYAALRLYDVLPPPAAFAFMGLLATAAGALAVMQDARALATLGAVGGFLAPLLVASGDGRIGVLLSYYLLLNLGVLGVAWFRAWRELNWIAFVFTFGVSGLWAVRNYQAGDYLIGQLFLVAFWLLFLFVSLLYAVRQQGSRQGRFDTTLVFALPLVAFGIQTRFTQGVDLAVAALIAGATYLVVSAWLLRRSGTSMQLLTESLFALGVGFLTLAIPLAASAEWTAAAWALEGVALLWVGTRQGRAVAIGAGLLLHLLASLALFRAIDIGTVSLSVGVSGLTLNLLVLAVTALASALLLQRARVESPSSLPSFSRPLHVSAWVAQLIGWGWVTVLLWQPLASPLYLYAWCALSIALLVADARREHSGGTPSWVAGVSIVLIAAVASETAQSRDALAGDLLPRLTVAATAVIAAILSLRGGNPMRQKIAALLLSVGTVLWLVAVVLELAARIESQLAVAQLALVIVMLTALALSWLAARMQWNWPERLSWAALAVHVTFAAYIVAIAALEGIRPASFYGWAVWPLAWVLYYLRLSRSKAGPDAPAHASLHIGALWLLTAMVAAELALQLSRYAGGAWFDAAWALVPAAALSLIVRYPTHWPMRDAPLAYACTGVPGLAMALLAWLLWANVRGGSPAPLPPLPLLNPLDLTSLIALGALLQWHFADHRRFWQPRVRIVLAAAAFFVANVIALRAVHFTAGVPWHLTDLMQSLLVQAVLSLLWTVIAMTLMWMAHRRAVRSFWLAGAGLLAVVIVKLLFVDLSGQGTIERIVSFVGVGLLVMAIGYLAPVPPMEPEGSREAAT